MKKKVTIRSLLKKKRVKNPENFQPLVATTAYDYTMAMIADSAGVDLILAGDSASSVIQGAKVPLQITLDEMVYHSRCVTRAETSAFVVGDLPFMSYQVSPEQALISSGRLIKEGGVEAVKLEGGLEYAEHVTKITRAGIPVVGHIGLTPQHYHAMGGFRVQGKDEGQADKLFADARALEAAGASLVVLEGIPATLAGRITSELNIPTIGIGAGLDCDGQILVSHDLLGLTISEHSPKFVKKYANLKQQAVAAIQDYAAEVRSGEFPGKAHSYK